MSNKRVAPEARYYEEAAITLQKDKRGNYYPIFIQSVMPNGITAEQAREAAHLLNQLVEYLDDNKKW